MKLLWSPKNMINIFSLFINNLNRFNVPLYAHVIMQGSRIIHRNRYNCNEYNGFVYNGGKSHSNAIIVRAEIPIASEQILNVRKGDCLVSETTKLFRHLQHTVIWVYQNYIKYKTS